MKKIGRLQVSTTKNSVHGASEVQLRIQKHWFVVCITWALHVSKENGQLVVAHEYFIYWSNPFQPTWKVGPLLSSQGMLHPRHFSWSALAHSQSPGKEPASGQRFGFFMGLSSGSAVVPKANFWVEKSPEAHENICPSNPSTSWNWK